MKNSLKILAAALSAAAVMSCACVGASASAKEEYPQTDSYYSFADISDLKKFVKLYKKDVEKAAQYYHNIGLNADDGTVHRFFSHDELEIFKNAEDYGVIIHAETIDEEYDNDKTFGFIFFTDEGYCYCTPKYPVYGDNAVNALSVKQIIKDSGIPDSSRIAAAELMNGSFGIKSFWAELSKIRNGWLERYDGESIPTSSGSAFCCPTNGGYIVHAYYVRKDGTLQTKSRVIDDVLYVFSPDGTCEHTYTGFAKTKEGRKYYIKGRCLKGWQIIDGKYYHFDENGVAATGKTKIGGCTYFFDKKGVWNGKRSKAGARPADFLITYTAGVGKDIIYSSETNTAEKLIGYNDDYSLKYAAANVKLSKKDMQILWSMICEGDLADSKITDYDSKYIDKVVEKVIETDPGIFVWESEPCWKYSISFTADGKTKTVKSTEDIMGIIEYDKAANALYSIDRFLLNKIRNAESYKALPPSEIYYD